MIEKMNLSPLEFTHTPSKLISFLRNQCKLQGEDYLVQRDELEFLYSVENSDQVISERHAPRRSGGTTLLGFIGLFYMLEGREVTFAFGADNMASEFYRNFLADVDVTPYKIKKSGRYSVCLTLDIGSETYSTKEMSLTSGNYFARGHSLDVILVDGFLHKSLGEHKNFINNNLLPCIRNNQGKIIMNVIC